MKLFFKCIKANYMLTAIVYALLGIFMLIWPDIVTRIVCYGFGSLLLVYGLVLIIANFSNGEKTRFSGINTINGLISSGVGIFFIAKYEILSESIGFVMGLVLVIDSFIKFQKCLELQKSKYRQWWIVLLLSFLTIALAVLVFLNPFGIDGLARFVGVCLLIAGAADIWIVIMHTKYAISESKTESKESDNKEIVVIDTENKD